ncbi:MAG: tetratricopeptide repeat protein [Acidobacteria bacterium]|nr:tetratricopeptide repeat protein [Acidobacteriota bacterium]
MKHKALIITLALLSGSLQPMLAMDAQQRFRGGNPSSATGEGRVLPFTANEVYAATPELLMTENVIRHLEFTADGLRYQPIASGASPDFTFKFNSVSAGGMAYPSASESGIRPVSDHDQVIYDRSMEGAEMYRAVDAGVEQVFILRQNLDQRGEDLVISGEAMALINIGKIYYELGEPQKAIDHLHQALKLDREDHHRRGEGRNLSLMGSVYTSMGENEKALECLGQALLIQRTIGDRAGEAGTLTRIGAVYGELGDAPKALEKCNLALGILRGIGDRRAEGQTLFQIGTLYESLAETGKALDHFDQALLVTRR